MGESLKAQIENVVGASALSQVGDKLKAVLVDYALGLNKGQPLTQVKKVTRELEDLVAQVLKACDSDETWKTYEAYTDVLFYGTPVATAAKDSEADLNDLTYLLAERSPESVDKAEFRPSKELKNKREVKPPKEAKAKKAARLVEEDDEDDDE